MSSVPMQPDSPFPYGLLTWGYQNNPGFESVRFVVPTGLFLRNGTPLNALCFVPVFGQTRIERSFNLVSNFNSVHGQIMDVKDELEKYDRETYDAWLKSRPIPGSQKAIQLEIEQLERELKK